MLCVLKSIVLTDFKLTSLEKVQTKTILRFIARLQCTWWLPYRSLVKRLKEIEAISDEQYANLYKIDEHDTNGEYGRLGKAINKEIFSKLNMITSKKLPMTSGTSSQYPMKTWMNLKIFSKRRVPMKVDLTSSNPGLKSIFKHPEQIITLDANFIIPPD